MIVTCPNCTTRLQLDEAKVPTRAFSVRCPKCQQIVNAQPPAQRAPQRDALAAVAGVPSTTRPQQNGGGPNSATAQQAAPADPPAQDAAAQEAAPESDVLRLLASVLKREVESGLALGRQGLERKRAVLCAGSAYGGEVLGALAGAGYDVAVAENVERAGELMREGGMSVVVLDPEFDTRERGASFVCAEMASMRMRERRRVLFVQFSDSVRTGDAHAAFVAGANLVVNTKDAHDLPRVLERNVRDLNELYKDFNRALGVADL
jgi:predicted Zn finger-like uncharacterized protein